MSRYQWNPYSQDQHREQGQGEVPRQGSASSSERSGTRSLRGGGGTAHTSAVLGDSATEPNHETTTITAPAAKGHDTDHEQNINGIRLSVNQPESSMVVPPQHSQPEYPHAGAAVYQPPQSHHYRPVVGQEGSLLPRCEIQAFHHQDAYQQQQPQHGAWYPHYWQQQLEYPALPSSGDGSGICSPPSALQVAGGQGVLPYPAINTGVAPSPCYGYGYGSVLPNDSGRSNDNSLYYSQQTAGAHDATGNSVGVSQSQQQLQYGVAPQQQPNYPGHPPQPPRMLSQPQPTSVVPHPLADPVPEAPATASLLTAPGGPTADDHQLNLGARWVSYVRSAEKDGVIEHMIDGQTTPLLQNIMLEAIFDDFLSKTTTPQGSPTPSSVSREPAKSAVVGDGRHTFLSLCLRDRANILISLLKRWKKRSVADRSSGVATNATATTTTAPSSRDYLQVCTDALVHYWPSLVTHQFGSIALSGLFALLPVEPHQARLARLALEDITASPTTLALDAYGNFLVSDLIKASSAQGTSDQPQQQPTAALTFVPYSLAQAWADPATFAKLAKSSHGAHVLDHFFRHAPASAVAVLWNAVLHSDEGVAVLVDLACDLRANYPLQTALKALRRPERAPHVPLCSGSQIAHQTPQDSEAEVPTPNPCNSSSSVAVHPPCCCLCCQNTAPRLQLLLLEAQTTFRQRLEAHLAQEVVVSAYRQRGEKSPRREMHPTATSSSSSQVPTMSKALQYSKNVLKILQ